MPESGGVVRHVEGYVKTIVFVYLPTKRAVRTRIVYDRGVSYCYSKEILFINKTLRLSVRSSLFVIFSSPKDKK